MAEDIELDTYGDSLISSQLHKIVVHCPQRRLRRQSTPKTGAIYIACDNQAPHTVQGTKPYPACSPLLQHSAFDQLRYARSWRRAGDSEPSARVKRRIPGHRSRGSGSGGAGAWLPRGKAGNGSLVSIT